MPAGLRTVLRSGIRAGALCVLAAWSTISQAAVPSGFFVETVARPDGAGWDQVVGVAFSKSGRLFAWEKTGSVWIVNPQQPLASRFLDLRDEVHAPHDHGLLGFALHPNFDSTGYVYALFTVERHHLINCDSPRTGAPVCGPGYVAGTHLEANATIGRIVRYRAVIPAGESDYRNARTVDPASRVVLLGESHWYSDPNQLDPLTKPRDTGCAQLHLSHGVGTLAFGEDGTLLASCGDGAHWTTTDVGSHPESFYAQALVDGIITAKQNVGTLRSQLLDSSSGKILRLDPISGDGIPSNPFYDAARPRAARSRVYALGFRNPYRFTVIPETGDHDPAGGNPGRLHVGDVGQYYWEELNVIRPGGANAGWPLFEGNNSYVSAGATTVNVLDAVNPLFNGTSCTRQYFRFTELLKQDTLGTPSWPNPCDASQQIVSTPVFLHDRPELSWGRTADARFPAFDGTTAVSAAIGTIAPDGMTVTGTAFSGNASVGGIWYGGASFPATYRDTYFHADYGAGWIRNMRFDANGTLLEVRTFADDLAGVVGLAEHPLTGDLYFAQYYNIKRIRYAPTSNIAPVAVAAADPLYGPSALSVQFSGAESSDPNGDSLTYSWDFGDGSPLASGATVSHTYTGAGIRNFDATLIVRDTGGLEGSSTLLVSLNNSPPQVAITSPVDGSQYSLAGTTTVPLAAVISDDESTSGELVCEWVKILHHSAHSHESSPITSCAGSMPIEPVGCVDDRYFYEVRLTVTDPHGLSTERSAFLYPDCGPSVDTLPPSAPVGLTATAISSARIDLSWGAATDAGGVVGYEVERCKGVLCTSFMPLGTSSGTTFSDLGLAASTLYRYRVRARDAAGRTGPFTNVAEATTPAAPPFALRLNAAGPAYTDVAGNGWSADSGFNTGSATTYAASTAIAGTSDPTLYRSERWDGPAAPELTYSFTVPNGSYQVRLHFAENYAGAFGVGLRVFDVQAEGVLAIDNLDVFAAVGANTALVRTINVTVTDGQLNLTFLHGVENPMVNAIEILGVPGTPDEESPSAPGTLAAAPNGAGRIDLAWGAATDNVAVTGYEIERCTGSACSNFAPLATVAGLGYNNSGLAASTLYRYRVRARDAAGRTGPFTNVAEATTPAAPPFALRLNAAGPAYTDVAGNGWSADSGFNTGSATTYAASTAIAGTSDPTLYRSERWDGPAAPELTYSFTVPNGSYQVRLHFAENYAGAFGVGLRVFDVQAEGVLAIDNLDVFAAVGANTALVRTINVTVTDGQLNLTFLHGVENPMVNAIEILEAP